MPLYAIIEHLLYRIFLQNTTGTLILREEQGLKITHRRIVILSVTIQYKQKTIKIGSWDLIKGDHDHLIEVAA